MAVLLQNFFDQLLRRSRRPPVAELSDGREPSSAAEEPRERRRHPREPASQTALVEWVTEDNQERAGVGRLVNRSKEGLAFEFDEALETGWPVLITPSEELPIKGVARHSRLTGRGWTIGVQLISNERRRFDRRPCDWVALLRWQVSNGGSRQTPIRICDVGEGGVRAVVQEALEVGVIVCILHEGWQRFGAVTSCVADGSHFTIGIQFVGPPRPTHAADYLG